YLEYISMDPPLWRALTLLIFLFVAAAPSSAIVTGGYSVAPGQAGALQGPPQDPMPISFWDLPPRVMLIALCLSFCPLLVYPVEIFFSLKLALALGYRKVEQYALSFNRNRQKILDLIIAHPGVKFHALERLTGMKEGTLKYHLMTLVLKRRIVSASIGSYVRYFENNGRYSNLEKKLVLHLQNPTTRRIIEILAARPEACRKDLIAMLGISGPSVSWYTKRLAGDGIITIGRNGKAVRYTLCPAGANVIRQFLGDDVAAACVAGGKKQGK
ncbi:MAG: winged helix-turn-helix transcriptional regulator, partial [Methanoregula sp.]|nr:winged helix-turn-helix transcriptional regulator [Methanoregula sp.]